MFPPFFIYQFAVSPFLPFHLAFLCLFSERALVFFPPISHLDATHPGFVWSTELIPGFDPLALFPELFVFPLLNLWTKPALPAGLHKGGPFIIMAGVCTEYISTFTHEWSHGCVRMTARVAKCWLSFTAPHAIPFRSLFFILDPSGAASHN